MGISQEDVQHIALLSRLALEPEELEKSAHHLREILAYAEKIQELPTEAVEPMSHSIRMTNVMRDGDEVGDMLSSEEALSNAPDRTGPYFRVPKVTESS